MDVVALQRSKHYIEGLNKMNQGAAVGVSPGEQCPQHQEAERERQAVGQGAYGGRRGRVRGLGLAATAWAQGGPLSPVGPRWSGRHSAGALSSLALTRCTDFFALGHRVQRGGCEALLVARRRELAGGGGASECARRKPGLWGM